MAVTMAIRSGRLRECVVRDANDQPKITDFALADREWEANTSSDHRERAIGPTVAQPAPRVRVIEAEPDDAEEQDRDDPTAREGMTKAQADAVAAVWKAKKLELEFKQAAEELIPKRDVENGLAEIFTTCRTRLLGVPTRVRQAIPHLTAAEVDLIEAFQREALEGLTAELEKFE